MYKKNLSNTPKLDILHVLKQRNNSFSLFKTNKHVEHEIEIMNDILIQRFCLNATQGKLQDSLFKK